MPLRWSIALSPRVSVKALFVGASKRPGRPVTVMLVYMDRR
jgi:hypothetical protein